MSHKTTATVAHTIGIDTGKNTLHLIGLDDRIAALRTKYSFPITFARAGSGAGFFYARYVMRLMQPH